MGYAVPVILAAVAAVAETAQHVSKGLADAASFENQARAAETNSRIAAMNAGIAESEGKIAAAQTAQDWYKNLGRQRAAMAQGGVLESPTGLLVRGETEERARDDLFQVQLQADLKKQGYLFQSADLMGQAKAARGNASQSRLGGWLASAGSFAGGIGQAYYYKELFKK
jgi:hypothetical protein